MNDNQRFQSLKGIYDERLKIYMPNKTFAEKIESMGFDGVEDFLDWCNKLTNNDIAAFMKSVCSGPCCCSSFQQLLKESRKIINRNVIREHKDKVIDIGEKEVCTNDDINYFMPIFTYPINSPEIFFSTKFFNWYCRNIEINTVLFCSFIKGLHLIERKYIELEKYSCTKGFGRYSVTYKLIEILHQKDQKKGREIFDWIAFNGGNYYINPGEKLSLEKKEIWIQREKIQRARREERMRIWEEKKVLNKSKTKNIPDERAKEIIRLREEQKMTFEMIGLRFGVSRERARQIYIKAIKK